MMLKFRIKRLLFLLVIMLVSFATKAQQTHFVYLQTDDGKPFYVRLNNKIVSSSSEGYLILPKLTDGSYDVTVGFPKKEFPEATFSVNVDNNLGYLVKHFDDKGLQLFNLETLDLIAGTTDSSKMITASIPNDTDPFSKMLANVVKDSSILQNHALQVQIAKSTSGDSNITAKIVPANIDSSQGNQPAAPHNVDTTNTDEVTAVQAAKANPVSPKTASSISKIYSSSDSAGYVMLYTDHSNDTSETVEAFFPVKNGSVNEKDVVAESSPTVQPNQPTITPTVDKPADNPKGFIYRKDSLTTKDSGVSPVQVFEIGPTKKSKGSGVKENDEKTDSAPQEAADTNQEKKNREAAQGQVILLPQVVTSSKVNSDCKAFATSGDFLRLRKKMAAESNSDDMIKVAKKYFRNKCFSTDQIKDLSYLFLKDEGKYKFFDAAYPHTSDSDQFETLESQLTDEYFINRFRAMIRK